MIAVLWAIGLLAFAVLVYFCSEGTQTAITYQPSPRTDEEDVQALMHEFCPRAFSAPSAKGFSRTPGAICCVFCTRALVWDPTDQVWDCSCVGARRSRVRVS